mmetsp:Transcript_91069/g.235138  ORF Transcript_91069/g.235138 Transcript_91069/m.235138 type:complete len:240 (+) Transcript_91069:136-855(+)
MRTGNYNSKVDMWSVGIITHVMPTGCSVIAHGGRMRVSRNSRKLSPEVQDFVHSLLREDPDHRLSASQALAHPWLMRCLPSASPVGAVPALVAPSSGLNAPFQSTSSRSSRKSPRTWWKNSGPLLNAMKVRTGTRTSWEFSHMGAEVQVVPSHSHHSDGANYMMSESSEFPGSCAEGVASESTACHCSSCSSSNNRRSTRAILATISHRVWTWPRRISPHFSNRHQKSVGVGGHAQAVA